MGIEPCRTMNLRAFLSKLHGRRRLVPGEQSSVSNAKSNSAVAAAELLQLGILQRRDGKRSVAVQTLMRVIALEHDCGEAHHNLGLVYLEQGHFEDAVDSLELATHFAPQLTAAHLDLSLALSRLDRHEAAAAACHRALELEPDCAIAWLRLGNIAKQRGDLTLAAQCYESAAALAPTLADAHCQRGFVLYKLGRYDESLKSYATALAINPKFVEVHHNLGLLQLETGYPEEALASFERALEQRPQIVETLTCVAHALRDLGRLDDALAQYDKVLARGTEFGDAFINRCYTSLMREDYPTGWAQYERRFAATATPLRGFPFPEWCGEPLDSKCILVYAEQGLGDEIMFASCVPDLLERCDNVVIECSPRLARLYARSFPRAIVHGGSKQDDPSWVMQLPRVDYQVAIGSLPRHFRQARNQFPPRSCYLVADKARVEFWRCRLASSNRLRVGIAWRGGSLRTREVTRSIALEQWLALLTQPGMDFVSLQYGDTASDLARLRGGYGMAIDDFSIELADLDELAAAIGALDLVISVDNTVAHLAGALGQSVWILLTSSPEWRYLRQGAQMPWYPSARLFRQPQPRAWQPVLEQVADALREHVATRPHV